MPLGSVQVADFNSSMAGNKNICKFCERTVAKSAHASRCFHCEVWVHADCGELVEENFVLSGYCVRKLSVPMIAILLAPRWVCR